MIRIGRNDRKMVRWMCNFWLEEYHDRMSAESKIAMVLLSRKNGKNGWPVEAVNQRLLIICLKHYWEKHGVS